MRIAMIGTRGVPARYGGFETCVEEVGVRLVDAGHDVVVYSRPVDSDAEPLTSYRGMQLITLPAVRKRAFETLSHTARSVIHPSLKGVDAAVVFNSANAPLLPALRAQRIPFATHVDGLEWRRAKWGPVGRRYYRFAESLAVRWSDALIADSVGVSDYYRSEFNADTELISYGAPFTSKSDVDRLEELDLSSGKYHLVVARFEPENHVLELVAGYARSSAELPLVVVGSSPYSEGYTQQVLAAADGRVRFLGGVWDQQVLDQLYAGALSYLHGHSVGGTNPSLLRAAGAGAPTIAFDVSFNREVLGQYGSYFRTVADVSASVEEVERDPAAATRQGLDLQVDVARYNWDDVARSYERLCEGLADGRFASDDRPSGRRSKSILAVTEATGQIDAADGDRVNAQALPGAASKEPVNR